MLTDSELISKIDKVSELAKKIVVDTAPYRYWINRCFELIELQLQREKEIRVLVIKQVTMGLTFFERERLKHLGPR